MYTSLYISSHNRIMYFEVICFSKCLSIGNRLLFLHVNPKLPLFLHVWTVSTMYMYTSLSIKLEWLEWELLKQAVIALNINPKCERNTIILAVVITFCLFICTLSSEKRAMLAACPSALYPSRKAQDVKSMAASCWQPPSASSNGAF